MGEGWMLENVQGQKAIRVIRYSSFVFRVGRRTKNQLPAFAKSGTLLPYGYFRQGHAAPKDFGAARAE
jgi:hypothetical protein